MLYDKFVRPQKSTWGTVLLCSNWNRLIVLQHVYFKVSGVSIATLTHTSMTDAGVLHKPFQLTMDS
jgi:hypothetical protein